MVIPVNMTQEEIDALHAQMEAERVLAEQARLAEIARVDALTARFNAIPDVHLAVHLAGLQISNPALVLKEAIESNDDTNLSLLETQVVNVQSKQAQEVINRNARKFLAECDWKRSRHLSQKALNITTSLTEQEYLEMEQACQNARNSIVD